MSTARRPASSTRVGNRSIAARCWAARPLASPVVLRPVTGGIRTTARTDTTAPGNPGAGTCGTAPSARRRRAGRRGRRRRRPQPRGRSGPGSRCRAGQPDRRTGHAPDGSVREFVRRPWQDDLRTEAALEVRPEEPHARHRERSQPGARRTQQRHRQEGASRDTALLGIHATRHSGQSHDDHRLVTHDTTIV